MKIAVVGCAHGQLELIYQRIESYQSHNNNKIDLLICCGDFQAVRNQSDLDSLACPVYHRKMGTFYQYYSGEKIAPVLTIFVGGNHEASNHLHELFFGGWVAPNIYYLGRAGVIKVGDFRIGGISGIFSHHDYSCGYYEALPLDKKTMRSIYHTREYDVWRFMQISQPLDAIISHDWPQHIGYYGDTASLLKQKPFFVPDLNSGKLGSPPLLKILCVLQPEFWFAAHLHVRFTAEYKHQNQKVTHFLALDKAKPERQFIEIFDMPNKNMGPLSYDSEWLAILRSTSSYLPYSFRPCPPPSFSTNPNQRYDFRPTESELKWINDHISNFEIPANFVQTNCPYPENQIEFKKNTNPQSQNLLELIDIKDPFSTDENLYNNSNPNEIIIDDAEFVNSKNPDEIDLNEHEIEIDSSIPKRQKSGSLSNICNSESKLSKQTNNPDEISLSDDELD